ncbi:MAG: ABC transporter permease [Anaerolineae bacterium]|jgi:peptide/nickel transport system permease protein
MAANAKALQLEPTTSLKPAGQWSLVWRRLRRHKLAMIGLILFGLVVLLSLLASLIAPYSYEEINLRNAYAPLLSPGAEGEAPHILGTDKLGRDLFSRLLYAGRISLGVALIVTLLTTILGTLIGAASGALGGIVDTVLMRFADIMLTLPFLPMVLVLSSSLRQYAALQDFLGSSMSVVIIIVILLIFGWMGNARLVRGSVLSLREQDFIDASRALGAGQARIILRHLVPNSLAPIIVSATLGFGTVIITESALSFLGFGIMPPVPTWGNMLNEARNSPLEYLFTQALSPGLCIFFTVLAINFVGDGLRDALDPRLKT